MGISCEYIKNDASVLDVASLTILDRLSIIESLVRDIHPSSSVNFSSPPASLGRHTQLTIQRSEGDVISGTERVAFTSMLDSSFTAATDKILQWPIFEQLLSPLQRLRFVDFQGSEAYTYLDDLFIHSNISKSSWDPSPSTNISTEKSDIEQLVGRFFNRVNIKNPILSRQVASQYCQQYYENGPQFNLETCLVLLMCALGAVSMEFDPLHQGPTEFLDSASTCSNLALGSCYFVAAEKRLGSAISNVNTLAIQCLCLSGIYHMFLMKPMHALRMFHAAGSSLQVLVSTGADAAGGSAQIYSSLFWTCYKSERYFHHHIMRCLWQVSDLNREILAEIPISAPALREPGTSDSYPPPDEWATHEEDSWYFFLSEIALRRITDQVTKVVSKYIDAKPQETPNIKELIPIVNEFERQAQTFRENLPRATKFPDVPQLASTEWQQYTRGRYYRLMELMHRPFLFAALHKPDSIPVVRALAEKALLNALRYLQHSYISHRHHGTWLQLRNELKEACLLLAGSKLTGLNMPDGWEVGIQKALATFDHWLGEFPACISYTNIILTLTKSSLTDSREDMSMVYT